MPKDTITELTDIAKKVTDSYATRFDVGVTLDWKLMKLQEEIGELVHDYLVLKGENRKKLPIDEAKQNYANELADVLCFTLLMAEGYDIDIAQAVRDKWLPYINQ